MASSRWELFFFPMARWSSFTVTVSWSCFTAGIASRQIERRDEYHEREHDFAE